MGLLAEIKMRFVLWHKLMEMEDIAREFLEEHGARWKRRPGVEPDWKFLSQLEDVYNRGRMLIAKIRELEERWVNQARSLRGKEARIRGLAQTITMEKKIQETLEDISIIREVDRVFKEIGPLGPEWKIAKILTWLGLESPWIKAIRKDEVIEEENWQALILEDRWGKPWDDMPIRVRKRYFYLRRVIEAIGGRVCYEVLREGGTKTVIMLPQKILELKLRKG